MDVSHNGISNIGESAFKGVGQLDYLNISFNSLREFKSNTFKGTVYIYLNSKLLAPVVFFSDPVFKLVYGLVWAEQHALYVHLISVSDQPGRNRMYHYIRKAKSLLS